MSDLYQDLTAWLGTRPAWQQDAAVRILTNGSLSEQDIDELVAAINTAEGRAKSDTHRFPGFVRSARSGDELRVESVGPVQGIENLAPRKPLMFGSGNLTVVFGGNGSGKSGYVRILKNVCGKPLATELRSNVFARQVPTTRLCGVAYSIAGKRTELEWSPGAPLDALRVVDIFDTDAGRLYLSKEAEASYTPPTVALLEQLASACDRVKERISAQLQALPRALPVLPTEYANTLVGRAYNSLRADQPDAELDRAFGWAPEHQQALESEEERLRSADPAQLARQKKTRAAQVDGISENLRRAVSALTSEQCERIEGLKAKARKARDVATEGAKATTSAAGLPGIGTATWRALWNAARKYSIAEAYRGEPYPYTDGDAKCLLCQQPLEPDAKSRLRTFETFVTGELEAAAAKAERLRDESLSGLPSRPDRASITTACVAAGVAPEVWVPRLEGAWDEVEALCAQLRSAEVPQRPLAHRADLLVPLDELSELSADLKRQAQQHQADAAAFDRAAAGQRRLELLARKWCAQQLASIRTEVARLSKAANLKELMSHASPQVMSRKASEVAEAVITSEYVRRFNEELVLLGASRLRVEVVKTRASHGKVMHRVALKGANQGVGVADVLSEGEKRVVELAAFLADVTGKPSASPFVFDDPISSLDQDFEERTAERLVALAKDRQVIVFTHRLSLLGILTKASEVQIHIRHEPWGAGEPGELALFAKRPKEALNELKNRRVSQSAKVLEQDGMEAYNALAKGVCGDLRILTERMVELVLLDGVVERHSREVKTKGKLEGLTKIEKSDCDLIDRIMTKYSTYEHSQSAEAPVVLPTPDELRSDIDALVAWHDQFKARKPSERMNAAGTGVEAPKAAARPVVAVK